MSGFIVQKLKTGDVFYCRSNAKFLNEVFGTNYKAWMRCSYRYSPTTFAWFVRIDGKPRNDFINAWLDKNTILQKYVGAKGLWDGEPLKLDALGDHRLVFEIVEGTYRKYIFQGVFLMSRDRSKEKEMLFKKVSDVFPMK